MKFYWYIGGFLILVLCSLYSCRKDSVTYEPAPYHLQQPVHFPVMQIPDNNPLTVEGVELGRYLFYETRLSGNNTISCASCHAPEKSFVDGKQFSKGIDGLEGTRNAMALINLGWQQFFFWDGRKATLEDQILEPIPNPIEMHQSWKDATYKLSVDQLYRNRFYKAFGTTEIDSLLVAKAIAQFLRTLISANSKYDVMYKYANNYSLSSSEQAMLQQVSPEEWAGFDLFKSLNGADCFHCHNGPLMQVQKYSNNGLDAIPTDLGRGAITGNTLDHGKFKVPTLRNIGYTAPYMHDGRFADIDQVIDHYSSGIQQSATIDPMIEYAFQGGVQLDSQEKILLKAFLMTLNDPSFINNPDFKDPN